MWLLAHMLSLDLILGHTFSSMWLFALMKFSYDVIFDRDVIFCLTLKWLLAKLSWHLWSENIIGLDMVIKEQVKGPIIPIA